MIACAVVQRFRAFPGSSRRNGSSPRPISVALFALVLLGVLGMHGLTSHGVMNGEHVELGAITGGMDMSQISDAECDTSACSRQESFAARGDDGAEMGFVTLCLAILSGVAIGLILGLLALRRAAPELRARTVEVLARGHTSGPDPPSLHELSLLRC
jgi:Family of unknown function (DUF6153)